MKKRLILLCVLVGSVLVQGYAQPAAQYSLWQLNPHLYNPAYAGLDNSLSAMGTFRRQWTGLEGAPLTQVMNVHLPVLFLNSGFGLRLENDALGATQNLTLAATYAYHLRVGAAGKLSVALEGGMLQRAIDGNQLNPREQDPTDVLIPVGKISAMTPIFGAGLFFKNDRLSLGLSASNLLESALPYNYAPDAQLQLARNYFAIFAYNLEIGSFAIEPGFLVKSDVTTTQIDISMLVEYDDNVFGGLVYRGLLPDTQDALALMAGWRIAENLTVAYAYDVPLSALNTVNTGSHEIMLKYNLNKAIGMPLPAKIIYNPRFTF